MVVFCCVLCVNMYDVVLDMQGLIKIVFIVVQVKLMLNGFVVGFGNCLEGVGYELVVKLFYQCKIEMELCVYVVECLCCMVVEVFGYVLFDIIDFGLQLFVELLFKLLCLYVVLVYVILCVDKGWLQVVWVEVVCELFVCDYVVVLLWGSEIEWCISELICEVIVVVVFGMVGCVVILLCMLLFDVMVFFDQVIVVVGVDIGFVYIVVVLCKLIVVFYNFMMLWCMGGYWMFNVYDFGIVEVYFISVQVFDVLCVLGVF